MNIVTPIPIPMPIFINNGNTNMGNGGFWLVIGLLIVLIIMMLYMIYTFAISDAFKEDISEFFKDLYKGFKNQ